MGAEADRARIAPTSSNHTLYVAYLFRLEMYFVQHLHRSELWPISWDETGREIHLLNSVSSSFPEKERSVKLDMEHRISKDNWTINRTLSFSRFCRFDFYRTRVRSLFTLVSNSLTHWLTDWLLFSKLDWCDPGVWRCQLKTCWGCYCCWCWCWGSCWQQLVDLGADVLKVWTKVLLYDQTKI